MAAINIEKLNLKELIALEAKVASAISAARDRGRADIKQKVAELAKTHGFSVSELFGGVRGRGPGKGKPVGVAKNTPTRKTRPIRGQVAAESRIGWSLD